MKSLDIDQTLLAYEEEVNNDLELSDFNLAEKQLLLPGIKHKWVTRLIRHKADLQKVESTRSEIFAHLIEQTIQESVVPLSYKGAEEAVRQNEKIQKLDQLRKSLTLVIDYLERVEKICSQVSFDIKNVIEIRKLELT